MTKGGKCYKFVFKTKINEYSLEIKVVRLFYIFFSISSFFCVRACWYESCVTAPFLHSCRFFISLQYDVWRIANKYCVKMRGAFFIRYCLFLRITSRYVCRVICVRNRLFIYSFFAVTQVLSQRVADILNGTFVLLSITQIFFILYSSGSFCNILNVSVFSTHNTVESLIYSWRHTKIRSHDEALVVCPA